MAIVTWNIDDKNNNVTLSNNNLTANISSVGSVRATIGKNIGKWYWEITTITSDSTTMIGIGTSSANLTNFVGSDANGWAYYMNSGKKYNNMTATTYGNSYSGVNIIGIALDCSLGKLEFFRNGISQGVAFTTLPIGTILYPMVSSASTNEITTVNFGATSFLYGIPNGYSAYNDNNKYLIKQNSNYYTINLANYDSTTTHDFTPLTLTGGIIPNKSDIETFGFNNLNVLTNSMTVGSDTFIPVLKFDNTAELKMYKPS